jgi:hypothetical protein
MSDQSPASEGTTSSADGPDPLVWLAFGMGWQMADLYRKAELEDPGLPPSETLPNVGGFTQRLWTALGIDQLQAGLHRLTPRLKKAGAAAPSLADLRVAFDGDDGLGAFKAQLWSFHIDLLTVLTAADFKLGKAYALGTALSDTVNPKNYAELDTRWKDSELAKVVAWLADLESAFPAHSARAVMLCIEHWELWLAPRTQEAFGDAAKTDSLAYSVPRRLFGQGRAWRALLSGEKQGTDMLATDDYVNAASRALSHTRTVGVDLLWKFREIVALVLVLLVIGVVLAFASKETAKILAGVGAFVSALGISWKTLGTGFRTLAEHVKDPLWGAEVDEAIAVAITVLPNPLDEQLSKKDRVKRDDELRRKYSPTGPDEATPSKAGDNG